ncbi:MAG TPA: hypothetical protein ENJ30_11760 [Desulfobulbaceae bacterium]|nr:hypothetical protein [Desulfobulbaceae bacterium]
MFSLALLWIFWCVLHSLLIAVPVNTRIREKGGFLQGAYRLFYVFFSTATLIPIIWYQYSLPQKLLFSFHGWWHLPQFFLLTYALVLFWYGKKNYDMKYFLGISQWQRYREGKAAHSLPFSCSGVLRYVRHPWYSGGMALLWAVGPITDLSLLTKIILSLYLVAGTLLEEHKLRRELGDIYVRYCGLVPMLIPWKGKVVFTKEQM